MHVVVGRHNGVGLLPTLVVEVTTVMFEGRQQRHHLTEDLLVRLMLATVMGASDYRRLRTRRRAVTPIA